jgi:nucleoside-diphosphate-sugar epimerase
MVDKVVDKVLVTGVAGFLGSFLAERLIEEGYYVVGIDNFFRGKMQNIQHLLSIKKFEFYEHDVRRPLPTWLFDGVEVVFHYAAINGTRHFYERPEEVLTVNVEGTLNVLRASIENGVRKFVFASSSEVYGNPQKIPITEDHPLVISSINNPRHSYAVSKITGEFYVKWFAERSGLKYLILRIFNTYGPRMDSSEYGQVIPEFIRKVLLEPEFTIIGPGTQTRSFCYIDDNIEMTLRAFRTVDNEVLNIGNNEEISILDLARILHEIVGRDFKYRLLPPREGDPARRVPTIKKVVSLTGYHPKISLKEGLMKTIEWYKKMWVRNNG